ncbi:AAA family ATPase [Microcoleus sp. AT9_B5]
MEKVFVHPECPFSLNTFNLLEKFYEDQSPDFYMAHKKDCLKYVEDPLKYILSQVEEQLPDFIKKYLNIKYEICYLKMKSKNLESQSYELALSNTDLHGSLLRLTLGKSQLNFGFYAGLKCAERLVCNYKKYYTNNVDLLKIFQGYKLPNSCEFNLGFSKKNDKKNNIFGFPIEQKPCIYELCETLLFLKEFSGYALEFEVDRYHYFHGKISIKSEEILGYSAKQLIQQIAQAFKKLFPLVLMSTLSPNDLPILISEYFAVYEQKFNPVYQLEEISKITGFQTTQLARWIHTINRKGQTIIQGPPGTGKTFLAQKLAQHLIGGGDGFSDIIQFHPAYTYEDFIQGIRPQSQNGQLTYSIVPGRFLELCEKAEFCEDTCVLIIDEINRANLSQVFGELMYLLDDRQDTARFITLASGKLFRIPTNVRIIGTMNTADRSIALVDNALRRRFAFIPLSPNYELLQNYHKREETGLAVDKLISILKNVNLAINNKHYELGISFFLTKTLSENIQDIWQMEIEPYLEEYFFDNLEKMDEFLWENIKNKLGY